MKFPKRINLFIELGVVALCVGFLHIMDWPWIIPIIVYAFLWLVWGLFVGLLALWKVYLNHKHRKWIKPPK
jgi:hypothetical protein